MSKVIIYKKPQNDSVCIITPCDCGHSVEEIAEKDVPTGLAYKIIDSADLPVDRTFRNAWTVDETELTDGTGGEHDMFITDPQHPDYVAPETAE